MCRSLTACTRATRLVTHNAGGPRSSFAATWSPNGQQLAYAQEPDTSGQVDIWTSRWNGEPAREVTFTGREFSPAWSLRGFSFDGSVSSSADPQAWAGGR